MKAALDSHGVDAGMFTTPELQSNLAVVGKYEVVKHCRDLAYPAGADRRGCADASVAPGRSRQGRLR